MESSQTGSGVKALPLAAAIGIVWGLGVMGCAIAAAYTTSYAHKMVDVVASVYPGYGPSWAGALRGLGWGVIDGFVGTLIILGVYRLLVLCCRPGRSATEEVRQ